MSGASDHRLRLVRSVFPGLMHEGPASACFIMCNPSEAGEFEGNDPTARRIIGFCRYVPLIGQLLGVNLFTRRASDPSLLRADSAWLNAPDADIVLEAAIRESDIVVAAWGSGSGLHPSVAELFADRARLVMRQARRHRKDLRCVGVTNSGMPRHPLYAPYPKKQSPGLDDVFPIWHSWQSRNVGF